jgi:outer membrane protein OmpA-like peptidoglycan-associated protein
MESAGVPKVRLVAVSLGENQPIASNDTVEGRAQNRRIEIRLRPVVVE